MLPNMNLFVFRSLVCATLGGCLGFTLLQPLAGHTAPANVTFDVLETKTGTYKNVTVAARDENTICIMHSTGLCSIAVPDLPPEVQEKLGFAVKAGRPADGTLVNPTAVTVNATAMISKLEVPLKQLGQSWQTRLPAMAVIRPSSTWLLGLMGIGLALYLFTCHCAALICKKAGHDPGALVWVPVLQLIPLLRAAKMSPAWVLGFFVPVVNLIGHVLWSVNITRARGKPVAVALLLLVPVLNFFAFVYLAYSSAAPRDPQPPRPEMMVLQTA